MNKKFYNEVTKFVEWKESDRVMKNKNNSKRRYLIVFICMLIQAIPYCISQNLQSQMQTPVSQSGVVTEVGFTLLYL